MTIYLYNVSFELPILIYKLAKVLQTVSRCKSDKTLNDLRHVKLDYLLLIF